MKGDEKLAFSNANDTIYYSNEAFVFFFAGMDQQTPQQ